MAIHSIQMWRTTLDNVAAWTASSFLLHSLVGYQAAIDDGGFRTIDGQRRLVAEIDDPGLTPVSAA